MSWVPDSGWLRALDLRASTAAALSVGCWAALGLAEFDLLYLGVLPAGIRATFVIIALIASLLWLGRLWDIAFGRFKRWRQRRTALAQLDTLSASEMKLLVDQLAKNEQSFEARLDDTVAAGLRQKGLALRYDTGHPLGGRIRSRLCVGGVAAPVAETTESASRAIGGAPPSTYSARIESTAQHA